MVGTKEGRDSPRAYLASRDRLGHPVCLQFWLSLSSGDILRRWRWELCSLSESKSWPTSFPTTF